MLLSQWEDIPPIIKRTGYATRNIYAECHVNSHMLLRITKYMQINYDSDVRNIHNIFGMSILTLASIKPGHRRVSLAIQMHSRIYTKTLKPTGV